MNAPAKFAESKTLEILIVRCDRIGDVVLSTPVFEVVKRNYPHSRLTVLVQEAVAPLLRGLPSVDEVMIYESAGKHAGLGGFFQLVREIRARRFRIAVVLQSQWRIAAAIFLAAIRYRIGPVSKPHSFFFYNRGVRQHRSQVEMHETDYNLQLLRKLGIRVGSRSVPVSAHLSQESATEARAWLASKGWNPEQPLIAVHPGMGGSALNWPEPHYVELLRGLLVEGKQVVVTGGPAEGPLLDRIRQALGAWGEKALFFGGTGYGGGIEKLAAIFSQASVVVAPSTGPMHLAVALGRPVVTFYPPIRVQSALRWGPYLHDEKLASILVPEVYCGEDFKCLGSLCNYYPCMKSLTVAQAMEEVGHQLRNAERTEA